MGQGLKKKKILDSLFAVNILNNEFLTTAANGKTINDGRGKSIVSLLVIERTINHYKT